MSFIFKNEIIQNIKKYPDKNIKKIFGQFLKYIRQTQSNISQKQMAKKLNMTTVSYGLWEKGERNYFSYENIKKISELLGEEFYIPLIKMSGHSTPDEIADILITEPQTKKLQELN